MDGLFISVLVGLSIVALAFGLLLLWSLMAMAAKLDDQEGTR